MWLLCLLACESPPTETVGPTIGDEEPVGVEEHVEGPFELDIQVALAGGDAGALDIRMDYRGLDPEGAALHHIGNPEEVSIGEVSLVAASGRAIPVTLDNGQLRPTQGRFPSQGVVTYQATPGGKGRHGHQGLVTDRFAVFDGRVFLQPRQGSALGTVRYQFELPDGWRVASALREGDDGWFYQDASDTLDDRRYRMATECIGLGPFDLDTETLGSTELRVWSHPDVPEALRSRDRSDTVSEFRVFHDRLGFDPGVPLSYVRTPMAPDGDSVFGGASARSTCFETTHPHVEGLNRRLVGHRFAHPYNRYPPFGLAIRDDRDRWFEEGWAGWSEVAVGVEAGVFDDWSWMSTIYRQHLDERRRHPGWATPLGREWALRSAEHAEFVHYVLAPLATQLLDHLLHERGETSLFEVSKELRRRHGHLNGAFDLRQAIDELGQASYADYWAAVAEGEAAFGPTWPGFVDDWVRGRMERPALAWSGDVPVHPDYLFHLGTTGDFETWHDVTRFVASEGPRRAQLAQAGVTLASEEVLDHIGGLGPRVRYELALAESRWPLHEITAVEPLEPSELRWEPSHPERELLQQLLQAESAYEAALGAGSGVNHVTFRLGPKEFAPRGRPVLSLPTQERLLVQLFWHDPPPQVDVHMVVGGETRASAHRVPAPGGPPEGLGFLPTERPTEPGIIRVRVEAPDRPTVERLIWQR